MERPEVRVAALRTCIPEGHLARCRVRVHAVGVGRMAGPEVTRAAAGFPCVEDPEALLEIPAGMEVPGVTEVACTTKKRLWTPII